MEAVEDAFAKEKADAARAALFIPNPKLRLHDQLREVLPAATGHPHFGQFRD